MQLQCSNSLLATELKQNCTSIVPEMTTSASAVIATHSPHVLIYQSKSTSPLQSQEHSLKSAVKVQKKPFNCIKMCPVHFAILTQSTCYRLVNEDKKHPPNSRSEREPLLLFQCQIKYTVLHISVIHWRPRSSRDYESDRTGSSSKNYISGEIC